MKKYPESNGGSLQYWGIAGFCVVILIALIRIPFGATIELRHSTITWATDKLFVIVSILGCLAIGAFAVIGALRNSDSDLWS